jgi:RimJ/RimL family protein N-acetyltransferase
VIPVELRSERLLLSMPLASDVDAIAHYCQDPLFEKYLTTPWPYARTDAEEYVERIVPRWWEEGSEFAWAIRSPDDSALLGMISWRTRGDLGFWMGAEHRGRGYMVEALTAVVDWVFADAVVDGRPVDRIEWETLPGNFASAYVARAAGFRFTGHAPVLIPARDGSHPDSLHAELRREDDRGRKAGWPL